MKNLITSLFITCTLFICTDQVQAQTTKTSKPVSQQTPTEKTRRFLLRYVAFADTASSEEGRDKIIKGIEMVANTAMDDWFSQYYAAFYNAISASRKTDTAQARIQLDRAETYIKLAEKLNPKESEIILVRGMIKGIRIGKNPALGEKLGPDCMNDYNEALKLNAENPRAYLVLGESYTYMPEEAGGGKKKAKEMLKLADKKYANDKHDDPAWPKWGQDRVKMLLAELEKN